MGTRGEGDGMVGCVEKRVSYRSLQTSDSDISGDETPPRAIEKGDLGRRRREWLNSVTIVLALVSWMPGCRRYLLDTAASIDSRLRRLSRAGCPVHRIDRVDNENMDIRCTY